ncbi:filamentous haemagglutinin family protein [Nitrosovibrio sp. Nv17]|uniref:filamentous haemagglutinin family protein n=1 Tax=Nitrosovibrio sp. Nv17 TaxID=1855339 RepID=UPI000908ABA1|nr:filamentous haemagglutinin family protein [Nitrosovibrio sp. Nv17]SFW38994.1 filamentous hemagglutinin family N-terminal domain-containing protein [Nitrosovibrio sp. Nv17]
MNRKRYRLVFSIPLSMRIPAGEVARSRGKATGGTALLLMAALLAMPARAELPVPCADGCGAGVSGFVGAGEANYHAQGHQAVVNQVGDKAILNWESFNVSPGHSVQFRQVENLATENLVQGANFTTLNRVWDQDPSVIAGIIGQATGQNANIILVNTNGIAFTGSAQVDLGSFTASSLNIADSFILDAFLTSQKTVPQFAGSGGFVKVLEGARITASSQGRVMLIAPTVVNQGTVTAPDGQVIAAAGAKVFLRSAAASTADANVRGLLVEVDSPAGLADFDTANADVRDGKLDGQTVALKDAALDKLGHVTNLGELSTPRGNITMVGYAVNQQGIARATTSVIANGSVYLLAKDRADAQDHSTRGGRVVLGAGSLTQVLPDVADPAGVLDGLTGPGLVLPSQVRVVGQDVRMEGGAVIDAPAGEVSFFARDNPSVLFNQDSIADPVMKAAGAAVSNAARIHIASGARISVAGLEHVAVSAARNSMEVELRGDELKDSPVNRDGPLRSQKVFVDVNRALANADAGKPTLIAKDSLQSYQARLERTVAERSTQGGTVHVSSQGEAIIESGAVIDLSGGSLRYTPAIVPITLVMSRGVVTDIANARADVRYDGVATRYVQDYGRWNVKEVIDLGQSYNHDPGYTEGKDAGALEVIALRAAVMQGDVQGRTTVGEVQRDLGIMPDGARLTVGNDPAVNALSGTSIDFKLNQAVELSSGGPILPAGFKFGDALSQDLHETLTLDPALLGKDKVAHLGVFSNQAAAVREALRAPQGGSVRITAQGLFVGADIDAPAGSIVLAAQRNDINLTSDPLNLMVADGVTLSARGAWVNELPGVAADSADVARVDGGRIALSAQDGLALGSDTLLDVTGGGRLRADGRGKVIAGDGGEISLSGNAVTGIDGNLRGYGIGGGGTLAVSSRRIQIGGAPDVTPGSVNLAAEFFQQGGFADILLTGRERLILSEGVQVRPTLLSLELQPGYTLRPSGSRVEDFTRQVRLDDLVRAPVNLHLAAESIADSDGTGDLLIGAGASIEADPRARVTLAAKHLLEIQGSIHAPGGRVTATLDHDENINFNAGNSIWLGKKAVLDVSGVALTYLDSQRLTQGEVLDGGSVTLDARYGYVIAEEGSRVDVSGAAPVRLDILNQAGGLGQWVGSDAGSLEISAREGVMLDGVLWAQAGGASNRGGVFDLALGNLIPSPFLGYPTGERILSLASTAAPQAGGLVPGAAIPARLNGQARLGAASLEAAGFDRIALKSWDVIELADGLNLGAGRALPLQEVTLDAPRIEMAGGAAALRAETVRLGNYDFDRAGVVITPAAGSGTLEVEARLLELAGNLTLGGLARAELKGAEEVRLAGMRGVSSPRPVGTLTSAADLEIGGAVIAPTTYSQFTIQAPGRTVAFFGDAVRPPLQPLSALGSLAVNAANIVQGGHIWAPFGQLAFNADDTLTFAPGSLTSIAAASGSLIPFGITVNGRSWTYEPDSSILPPLPALPGKSIRTQAPNIDMQAGATFDLAGGGDLQAYEFSVGPGGSHDILDEPDIYAVLPGYASAFAPGDRQESAGFVRAPGDAVYLSGLPGLPAGTYTLLPAHYALLPGAYAVRLNAGVSNLLPGQAYGRQDGIQVVPGYLTDSRHSAGGPRDALWSGFEVLTRDQVLQRSEITLTRASDFFAASQSRPQDAGLLSIDTAQGLKLDALFRLAAAEGGRGAAVDLSAPRIVVTGGASPAPGGDPSTTYISADTLDAMGAESLFLGGTRNPGSNRGDPSRLTVTADEVTLANDAAHVLKSGEIILAAKDILTLAAGSAIETQGGMGGEDAGVNRYETAGNGALLLAGSAPASFARSGSPDRSLGTLVSEAGSTIRSGNTIILDATRQNAFAGTPLFADDQGGPVAGNLAIGATRVNFGAAPAGAEGLTFSQSELDGLDSLGGLTLTSYSTFDLYGDVRVGGVDANGRPTLQALTLQGAGLAGLDNSGATATLRAQTVTLANPAGAGFVPGGAAGDGTLALQADTLVLGEGDKSIGGFSRVEVAANELVGRGSGNTAIDAAAAALEVARISGEKAADQTLTAAGGFAVTGRAPTRTLMPVMALGAKWALSGADLVFDTVAVLPSGQLTLAATVGDLVLGSNARVDAAGRGVAFFDVSRPSPGGAVELASDNGDVVLQSGARVDVSAAAGGDAGKVTISTPHGSVAIAAGSLWGMAAADADGVRGEGGRFDLDVDTLADFSALNTALNQGGFDGARALRVRGGDVSVAAGDTVKAEQVRIAVDGGRLDVAGHIDASGEQGGSIRLDARDDVALLPGARLDAYATGNGKKGGEVELGTTLGRLNLAAGSSIDVSGGSVGEGGEVLLRAPRIGAGAGSDVAVEALGSAIHGADSTVIEAVRVYDGIALLTAAGASSGTTLSLGTVNADNDDFVAHTAAIASRLGRVGDAAFHVRPGIEVRASGDLTLGSDWNLGASRASGEPGMLTLRVAGNLNLNGNLSDGFNVATPCSSASCSSGTITPATLLAGDSWGYRLVAGADVDAADPLAVRPGAGDVTLAAGKLVRTGTGDIRIVAGGDIRLANNQAVIYTAGRAADVVAGFTVPANAQFSQGGGDVSLKAAGDIVGSPSTQLYSNWLFRQGKLDASTGAYTTQPAWWVRFDQFQQGIGALGGGDVTLTAGGKVENVSASVPTQARMAAAAPDAGQLVQTGGGDVRVRTGGDLLGGQYYVGHGELVLQAGGKVDSGQTVGGRPLYTILALGDAQARVQAHGDVNIQSVLNPHLVIQSTGSGNSFNLGTGANGGIRDLRWSLFSTYSPDSGVQMQSLNGTAALSNAVDILSTAYSRAPLNFGLATSVYNFRELLSILPPSLAMTAFQGDVMLTGNPLAMSPATRGDLALLAAGSVNVLARLVMSDRDPARMADAVHPGFNTDDLPRPAATVASRPFLHAPVPVHTGDPWPARVYAIAGDVRGNFNQLSLDLSKAVRVRAGRDVSDLGILAQHANAGDLSQVVAGRDVVFTTGGGRSDPARIWVGGLGRLEVTAGRNLDLGTSAGIVSRGDLDNAQLPTGGVDIDVAAGVGPQGLDYAGAVDRLIAALEQAGDDVDDALLWQARWLTGKDDLAGGDALAAARAVRALEADALRGKVREWAYTALLVSGRDSNVPDSPYAGDFGRGYAALELLFPGIGEQDETGGFKHYQGDINLFASRIKTERGGHIEFMAPGGDVIVGLANTPAVLVDTGNDVLGMVAVADGSVRGFSRGDILVNQSRILTLGGGDVLLWSSEGDIDAGKGKKTAVAVPPPLVKVDAQGNVTQELQGAASGSGIGALSTGGLEAGDIDLVAPKGTVDAGDAGIRARNLNIAAQVVLGADNISVSGTSTGTPVADASAVSAVTSGATSQGDDVSKATAALSQNLSDAARTADAMKKLKPTFISAEVIGRGE